MRFLDQIDRGAIEGMLGRDEYFWLDLDAPSEADVAALDDLFHWHPLAMEDLRKKGQRPKLEDFDQYMFLVYYGAAAPEGGEPPPPDAPVAAAPARGERVDLEEVHAFISGSYLVTVHDGACTALDEVRKRLDQQAPSSEQFVVYRVLDALTDSFFPLLEDLEDRLEQLDEEIFSHPSPDHLQPLTELRRRPGHARPGGDPAARPARPPHRRHPRNPRPAAGLEATTSATSTTTRSGSPTRSTPSATS